MEQLETRSDPDRDLRERVLATAYLALVATDVSPRIPADTAWHPVDALPETAFDHGSIIGSARERLRAKLSYTNIGFALAPAAFTIAQLRDIYVASLGYPVSATNLQRILTRRRVIKPTVGTAPPTAVGGRPAALYEFVSHSLVVTNAFAAFRPRPLLPRPLRPLVLRPPPAHNRASIARSPRPPVRVPPIPLRAQRTRRRPSPLSAAPVPRADWNYPAPNSARQIYPHKADGHRGGG